MRLRYDLVTTAEVEFPAAGRLPPHDAAGARDLGVIAVLFVVLMLGIAAVDALSLSWPPIRSFCLGGLSRRRAARGHRVWRKLASGAYSAAIAAGLVIVSGVSVRSRGSTSRANRVMFSTVSLWSR